jgi:MacB-like periplasmic core domain
MQTLLQDLRFALRMMRKAPGFTIVAVLALALGIGVNTAILSTVNGFILRPLPIAKPTELITLFWGRKSDPKVWDNFSYPNFVDVRNRNQSFTEIAAYNTMNSANLSTSESRSAGESGRAEIIWGETVSGNYFDVMGVKPILGRGFLPEEDRTQNTHPVVGISHALRCD